MLLNLNEEANYLETLNTASKRQEQEMLDRLENIKDKVDKAFSNQKELSQKAFEQYFELLNNDYEKKTIEPINSDKKTIEERFFIISFENDIKTFADAVRKHWGVENNLHAPLDIVFKEDDNTTNSTENV